MTSSTLVGENSLWATDDILTITPPKSLAFRLSPRLVSDIVCVYVSHCMLRFCLVGAAPMEESSSGWVYICA